MLGIFELTIIGFFAVMLVAVFLIKEYAAAHLPVNHWFRRLIDANDLPAKKNSRDGGGGGSYGDFGGGGGDGGGGCGD